MDSDWISIVLVIKHPTLRTMFIFLLIAGFLVFGFQNVCVCLCVDSTAIHLEIEIASGGIYFFHQPKLPGPRTVVSVVLVRNPSPNLRREINIWGRARA